MKRAVQLLAVLCVLALAAGVASANSPPVAEAGPDQAIVLGEPVMLQGSASDPDGDATIEWSWAIESAPEGSLADLPDSMLSDPLFLPDLPGDYVLSLVVSDGLEYSPADAATVSVAEAPGEPDPVVTDTMAGWGDNSYCQAVYPGDATGSVAIAAGLAHTLAVRADGTVVAWGNNVHGQCTVPAGLSDVAIAAGYYHNLALRADGSVVAWGDNSYGQCNVPAGLSNVVAIAGGFIHSLALHANGTVVAWGDNQYGQRNVPAGLTDVVAVAAGTWHSLALRANGSVVAWGDNFYGQCTVPAGLTDVVAIATGYHHSLALRADGSVVAWGRRFEGQCNVPAGLTDVAAIAGGHRHSLALRANGTVVAWGLNTYGQCNVPAGLSNVVAIAATGQQSVALRADGTVVAWGDNGSGQCNVPAGLPDPVAVVAGGWHSLALRANGTVVAWGSNPYGQCNVPAGLSSVVAIAAGLYHSLALRADGSVAAWGNNSYGQCTVPAGLSDVVAIAAGSYHSLALCVDGSVVAWGSNVRGQCTVPAGLSDVVAIASGGDYDLSLGVGHSLALKSDGTVVAWGDNFYEQCTVPAGLSDVVAIAAGRLHSLALRADGTVVAWGYTVDGQCTVPAGLTHVVAVATRYDHSLALRADGTVVAWGRRYEGQCNVPAGLTDVVTISAGAWHNLALLSPDRPPVAEAGPDQVIEASSATTTFILDGTMSSDPDGDTLTYAWTDAGGNTVGAGAKVSVARALGSYRFTLTVTDPGGRSSSDTVTATIQDTTPPTLNLPGDLTVEATSAAGVVVEFDVTADDLGGGSLQITYTSGSGSVFPLGQTTVTCTATDSSGNTATGSFTVTVADRTPPTLQVPATLSVTTTNPAGTIVDIGTATASDLADPNPVITNDAPAVLPVGVTTVTWTATDVSGNVATASQTVTVILLRYANFTWHAPMSQADSRLFKRGSTIPLKFTITDLHGNPANSAAATLRIYYYHDGAPNGDPLVVSLANGDEGDQFRNTGSGQYSFNLSTRSPEWYPYYTFLAEVTLDDGQVFTQPFSLK